ncbi:hypothetical protein JXJ21_15435 [candidate division KSB1 bacterium]|nr:hypothetical protein [candidate division KSB1 bacterium]
MPQKQDSKSNDIQSGIEQIRDIIFGEQTRAFQRQMDELKNECAALKKQIAELGQKHMKSDQQINDNMEKWALSANEQQRFQNMFDQMKSELERKIADLDELKVDKSQIGQAFIEWGTRVKQAASK